MRKAFLRPSAVAAFALAALAMGLSPADGAPAKMKDLDELNCQISLPEGNQPGIWDWEAVPQKFAEEHGAKVMAKRFPELLKDGKTQNEGYGARLMLTVQDVPASLDPDHETWLRDLFLYDMEIAKQENLQTPVQDVLDQLHKKRDETRAKVEAALTVLAGRPEIQAALLHRFGDGAKGKAKVRGDHEIDTIPAALVEIEGTAPHLGGVPSQCIGKMVIWVIRKRFYRLAMWAWPVTKDGKVKDAEHFKDDLDFIEMNSITIPKKDPIPRRSDDTGPTLPKSAGADAAGDQGTPARMIVELPFAFQVQKPEGWRERTLDRSKEEDRYMGFQIDSVATREGDHAIVDLLVYRVEMGALTGFKEDDHFVRSFKTYLNDHKTGPLTTHSYPLINAKTPFLSLPDLSKKKEVKRPASLEEVSRREDLEKLGVVTEAKNSKVKDKKVRRAWRFCVATVTERGGPDTLVQYVWSTDKITFLLRMTIRGQTATTQAAQLKTILSSFEIKEE